MVISLFPNGCCLHFPMVVLPWSLVVSPFHAGLIPRWSFPRFSFLAGRFLFLVPRWSFLVTRSLSLVPKGLHESRTSHTCDLTCRYFASNILTCDLLLTCAHRYLTCGSRYTCK
ncbi:hypothetical protein EV361DRAFT_462138 [Lentinula raphanica]|nr:hypothetical protein EV361DRAFT_462138 [Lentinula raphanica]